MMKTGNRKEEMGMRIEETRFTPGLFSIFYFLISVSCLLILLLPCMAGAETFYVCDTEADCEAGALADTDWVTGNDGYAGTSKATALKTIQAAVIKCTPGQADTIIVGAGTYVRIEGNYLVTFTTNDYGQDVDNPWLLRAETISNISPEVCLDGDQSLVSHGAIRFVNSAHWIKVQGFEIKDFRYYGILGSLSAYNIEIDQCVIHDLHAWIDDDDLFGLGIGVHTHHTTRDFTVTRSNFHNNGRDPDGCTYSCTGSGCAADYGHDHHMYLQGSGHEIYNNIFYDTNAGWAISIRGYSGADDGKPSVTAINNTFYGSGYDFGRAQCGTASTAAGAIHVYTNFAQETAGGPRDCIFRNNVFLLPPEDYVFEDDLLDAGRALAFWGSLTWENNVTTSAGWWSNPNTFWDTYDEDDFASFSGNHDGTTTPSILDHADLGMTDPSTNDFTLTSSASYLINSGLATGAPSDDYAGILRPQDGAYDVGAYEYGSGAGPSLWTDIKFWWRFEGSDFNATNGTLDYSASDDIGDDSQTPTYHADNDLVGDGGKGLALNAQYERVTFTTDIVDIWDVGSDLKIGFLWKTNDNTDAVRIISFVQDGTHELYIHQAGNDLGVRYDSVGIAASATTTGNHIVNGTEYYVEITIDFEDGNDTLKIEYFTDADGVSVDSAIDNDAAITDFGTPTSLVVGDLGGGGPDYVIDNLIISDDLTRDIKTIRAFTSYPTGDETAPGWASAAFDSDCDGTADGGDGTTYTTADGSICIICTADEPVTAYIGPGESYIDLDDGTNIRFLFYSGIGDTKFLFRRTLLPGDRTASLKVDASNGVQVVAGLEIYDLADNAMVDYDTNVANVDLGTSIISCPGVITIGSGGDYPLWSNGSTGFHDLSYDIDEDKFNILAAFADDFAISADNVRIRGTGGNVAITGSIELLGACSGTIIKCLTFSGGITDNGNAFVYQEDCRGQMID